MAEIKARRIRRALFWSGVAAVVVLVAFLVGLSAVTTPSGGPTGPGSAVAAQACSTFREGLRSAAAGTATNADADRTISTARRKADAAATLNSDYQPLLVLLTAVANGGGDGLAVLDECNRLGL